MFTNMDQIECLLHRVRLWKLSPDFLTDSCGFNSPWISPWPIDKILATCSTWILPTNPKKNFDHGMFVACSPGHYWTPRIGMFMACLTLDFTWTPRHISRYTPNGLPPSKSQKEARGRGATTRNTISSASSVI